MDMPGELTDGNSGDSAVEMLLWRRRGEGYDLLRTVAASSDGAGESFRIGERAFFAVTGIRGKGPYHQNDRDALVLQPPSSSDSRVRIEHGLAVAKVRMGQRF